MGVSSIVALGTGAIIAHVNNMGVNVNQVQQAQTQAIWLRGQLRSVEFTEQSSGVGAVVAGACANGSNASFSPQAAHAAQVSTIANIDASLAGGGGWVPLCFSLPDGTVFDTNTVLNPINSTTAGLTINNLRFTNTAVVATDAAAQTKTYAGDLYYDIAVSGGPSRVNQVFITRMVLQVSTSGAQVPPTISKFNIISTPTASKGPCTNSQQIGFNTVTGKCFHQTPAGSVAGALTLCPAGTLTTYYDGLTPAQCVTPSAGLCNSGRAAVGVDGLVPVCSLTKPFTNSGGPPPGPGGSCSIPVGYPWTDSITLLPCVADSALLILDGGIGTAVDSANPASPNRGSIAITCTAGVPSGAGVCHQGPTQVVFTGGCTLPAGTAWTDSQGSNACTSDAAVVIQSNQLGTLGDATSGVNRGTIQYSCTAGVATVVGGTAVCMTPGQQPATTLTVVDPSCQAYALAYTTCVAQAAITGIACQLPAPPTPPQTCGSNIVEAPAAPAALAPQPKLGAAVTTCACGSTTIQPLQYCGFCAYLLDIGYGGGTTSQMPYTRVEQCQDGGLTYLSNMKLSVPADPAFCQSGLRQVLNCDPASLTCTISQ